MRLSEGAKRMSDRLDAFVGHIAVYGEICCEMCSEVIHNHLDCPVCGKKYASSENFHDLFEYKPRHLVCECGAIFETDGNPYDDDTTWTQVPNTPPQPPALRG